MSSDLSRRGFLSKVAAVGAVGVVGINALTSCSDDSGKVVKDVKLNLPPLLEKAPDGKPIRCGLIGCGGRGTGAALNHLNAGSGISIVALGDVFDDRLQSCRKKLKEKANNEVEDKNCFIGFDAYEKVLACDVDVVILATPPHFRPIHFAAAVAARKNAFLEKPVAVDPVGCRSVLASAKKAEAMGLKVVCGTQRQHQRDYVGVYEQVKKGAIGEITGANAYWNGGKLWHRNPKSEWSEMESHIRDWVNWTWLSGDHIVEQHVHNIDVVHWFTGKYPVKAVGFGSRQRRLTGNQYDNFSIDYTFDNEMHMHSMCRQMNGCTGNVSEFIQGTDGYTNCKNTIFAPDGTAKYKYAYPKNEKGEDTNSVAISPYDQEHIDLITCIRQDIPINKAEGCAKSTLAAIMGRMSAYSGKEVTWEEVMNSDLHLGPKIYAMGDLGMEFTIPVPGEAAKL